MIESLSSLELELAAKSGVLFLVDVPEGIYRQHSSVSQSELKAIVSHSPEHYRHYQRNPRPEKESLKLGRAYHTALLEPERYEKIYHKGPDVDRRTTRGRSDWQKAVDFSEANNLELLAPEDYNAPIHMRDHIFSNLPHIAELFSGGVPEKSSFGFLEETPFKIRKDYYRPQQHQIVDLKSTRSAAPQDFERDIRKFRYHWQAAVYTDLVHAITGEPPEFFIVACEKTAPYGTAIYKIRFDLLAIARKEIRAAIKLWRQCFEKNHWPGYSAVPSEVGAHKWEWDAYKKDLHESQMGKTR